MARPRLHKLSTRNSNATCTRLMVDLVRHVATRDDATIATIVVALGVSKATVSRMVRDVSSLGVVIEWDHNARAYRVRDFGVLSRAKVAKPFKI